MVFGSRELYEWVDNNPGIMAAPLAYVNDPRIIGQIDNMISINNCIAVDLYGQICAESVGRTTWERAEMLISIARRSRTSGSGQTNGDRQLKKALSQYKLRQRLDSLLLIEACGVSELTPELFPGIQ